MSGNLFDMINPKILTLVKEEIEVEIKESGKPKWLNGVPNQAYLAQP